MAGGPGLIWPNLLQMLMPEEEHSLVKEGVLYVWTMLNVVEQSYCLLTAVTVELVSMTVLILRTLE